MNLSWRLRLTFVIALIVALSLPVPTVTGYSSIWSTPLVWWLWYCWCCLHCWSGRCPRRSRSISWPAATMSMWLTVVATPTVAEPRWSQLVPPRWISSYETKQPMRINQPINQPTTTKIKFNNKKSTITEVLIVSRTRVNLTLLGLVYHTLTLTHARVVFHNCNGITSGSSIAR